MRGSERKRGEDVADVETLRCHLPEIGLLRRSRSKQYRSLMPERMPRMRSEAFKKRLAWQGAGGRRPSLACLYIVLHIGRHHNRWPAERAELFSAF